MAHVEKNPQEQALKNLPKLNRVLPRVCGAIVFGDFSMQDVGDKADSLCIFHFACF